jgi:EAL and modified HD-GYP domain-containing signal transduction protein
MPNLLARQPIYDAFLRVTAYELLFRPGGLRPGEVFDGDQATSSVIINAFLDRTVDQVVGNVPAFINMTPKLLTDGTVTLLPKDRVVLEILETTVITPEILATVRQLRSEGYRFALDDYVARPDLVPLLELVDFVKIDVLALDLAAVERELAQLQSYRLRLVAEKVETHEVFESCRQLGFTAFQGYFLSRPNIVPGRPVQANQMVVVRLLSRMYDANVGITQLEELIQVDATLSYRLLRLVNSAFYNLPRKLRSIHEALVILGIRTTRMWVTLIALAGLDEKPPELFAAAMTRAKLCEILARRAGVGPEDSYFVVGLFSLLDAVLDRPLDAVLADLPLSRDVSDALLHRSGTLGDALRCAVAFEQAAWGQVSFGPLDEATLGEIYVEALQWSRTVAAELERP